MPPPHKYLPVNDAQRVWGLFVTCAGHGRIDPGAEFPPPSHPDEYFFSWKKGRVLREWQIGLIEDGRGEIEFRNRRHALRKNTLFVLPPGQWHRYRPEKKTGWSTLWIGFGGDLAGRLVDAVGIDPEGDVLDTRNMHGFHRLFSETVTEILERGQGSTYSTAARVPALIAALIEGKNETFPGTSHTEIVHRAQTHIAEHADEIVDFERLSAVLGIPYRTFRHVFAKETGTSPHQYQLGIRLNRAKNLLRSTKMPIAEIAESLGFNSTWYFAHFFRKRVKTSAAAYRRKHRLSLA